MMQMTPVLLQQFRLFYAQGPAGGGQGRSPIGVVLWAKARASLPAGSAQRCRKRPRKDPRLRPQDWKSGAALPPAGGPVAGGQPKAHPRDSQLWVVEVIAPAACPGPRAGGGAEEMVKDLKAKVFPDREIRFVRVTAEGRKEVGVA